MPRTPMTEAEEDAFFEAAFPLILWMKRHTNPHALVQVSPTYAELLEDL